MPLEPPSEWLAVAAGPLANLGVCFLAALCLALRGDANLVGLMNPFSPTDVLEGQPLAIGLKLTFWINWLLVLVNLIPAYPFDGGRALRAALLVIRPRLEPQRAVMIVAAVAKLIALGLLIVAWLVRSDSLDYVVQSWFALVLLAVFVFFSARKAESMAAATGQEEAFLGYDFSEGYTSLERSGPKTFTKPHIGPLVRWWQRRRELREQKQRELEAFEDCRVDEILSQVHQTGLDSLSPEDRSAAVSRVAPQSLIAASQHTLAKHPIRSGLGPRSCSKPCACSVCSPLRQADPNTRRWYVRIRVRSANL